ncbi:MAG TPA: hypothetical protein VNI02_01795 [Blastocatellia bacterium]|jgi:molybdenum-dependent DNA-binding transcriptional regulator ModE|nr:hypothetical protein [Blastocatellia bacterium]
MESIAITAATLVAKWLGESVVKEAGKSAWTGLQRVYEAVKAKLVSDHEGGEALERLTAKPSSQARASELAEVLDALVKSDPEFAAELRRVIDAAEQDPATASFVTEVKGNARVGKITNIGSAGDVRF